MDHPDDEAVLRVEVQLVQRSLHPASHAHREFGSRELEQRVDLEAGATAEGIFDGDPPGADIASGADLQRVRMDLATGLTGPEARQQAEVPIAEVGASISDSALAVELPIGIEEPIGIDEVI